MVGGSGSVQYYPSRRDGVKSVNLQKKKGLQAPTFVGLSDFTECIIVLQKYQL